MFSNLIKFANTEKFVVIHMLFGESIALNKAEY